MEYFNFEEASFSSNNVQDDVASDCLEVDEADAVENFDSLFFDKTFQLHSNSGIAAEQEDEEEEEHLPDPELEALPAPASSDVPEPVPGGDYPMFRSTEPCDFCRRMGFDCFIIQRGVLNNGCTCCVSLYRECSFTHAKAPGKFLHTLHTVGEDIVTSTGGLTGRRALKSLGSNNFDDLEARGRKSGARLGREAVRILKTWLSEHYQHPYPTEEEKNALKERTGLKRSQIANWLANARRRGKVRPPTRGTSPVPGAVNIPRQSSSSSSSSPSIDMSLMTPLERWKHSPPEHEPASTSDIIRAMANTPFPPDSPSHLQQQHFQARPALSGHGRSVSRKTGSSNDSSSMLQAPSVSSYETENRSSISDFSFASAFSHRSSQHSFNSGDRKERRRRRKQMPPVPPFERQKTRGARIFQCTFCTDSFPAKYDWQRHEKSLHLALEKWTCAPQGGVVITSDGQKACAFCRAPNPTEDHLEMHNYSACQEKTMQERTFYRKDHLNQHLRLMHNVKFDSWMNQWRSTTNEIKSRCGFCDAQFTTWKDRVDHLAQHFKNGADMSQWKGDWGFEPYVRRLVENAVPPYLIAEERVSPNPYKAEAWAGSSSNRSSSQLRVAQDANCFARLERELKSFIESKLQAGIVPTDQIIQDHARITIYGSDDHWNQTCADNPVWLSILKRDCGIETVPDSEHLQLSDLGMQPPFAGDIQRPPLETNPMAGHLRKSWLSRASLDSPAPSRSGLHSPGFLSNGFHSAGPSMPGSLAGSFAGSAGVSSGAHVPGLSSGWSSSFSAADQSSSAPASAMFDPFAGVGLDLDFFEQFNDNFTTLPQGMESIGATDFNMQGLPSEAASACSLPAKVGHAYPTNTSETQPISIPAGTTGIDPSLQQYADISYMARSNFQ